MRWNPYINAAGVAAYIGVVVLFLQFLHDQHKPDSAPIDGMGALSLLVFSVAVMGFLFFYRPAILFFENRRTEAVSYFLKTLATFGAITIAIFAFVSAQ